MHALPTHVVSIRLAFSRWIPRRERGAWKIWVTNSACTKNSGLLFKGLCDSMQQVGKLSAPWFHRRTLWHASKLYGLLALFGQFLTFPHLTRLTALALTKDLPVFLEGELTITPIGRAAHALVLRRDESMAISGTPGNRVDRIRCLTRTCRQRHLSP